MSEQQTSGKGAASGSLKKMRMQQAMSKERSSDKDHTETEGGETEPQNSAEKRPEQADSQRGGGRSSVRVTVDLKAEQHKFLKHFAVEADSTSTKVLRRLLEIMESDEALRERLRQELQ